MTNTVWEELNPLSGPKNYLRAFSWSISETCTVKYHIQQAQTCLRTWWPTATECPVHLLPKRTEKKTCPPKCKVLKETPRHALPHIEVLFQEQWVMTDIQNWCDFIWQSYMWGIHWWMVIQAWDKLLEQRAWSWSEKHCTHAPSLPCEENVLVNHFCRDDSKPATQLM